MEENYIASPFVYRSYSKQELAQMYLPGYARATAIKKFNSWLKLSPLFREQLQRSGVEMRTRIYSVAQVRIIVGYLGEP